MSASRRPSLSRLSEPLLRRLPLPESASKALPGRHEKVLLELDLNRGAAEAPSSPLAALRGLRTPQLAVLIERLREAADDDEVAGLVVLLGGGQISMAQSDELRAAITAFRASRRPVLAWAASFGEMSSNMADYHVATACERIMLQPSGTLGIAGFVSEPVFLAAAFDKLGIDPQFGQRHEYKSAAETFTSSSISEPNREMLERLLESLTEIFCSDVAAARGLSPQQLRVLIDQAPLTAQAALEARLIDSIGYRDQAYAEIRSWATEGDAGPARSTAQRSASPRPSEPEFRLSYVERHGTSRLDALREQVQGMTDKLNGKPQVAVVHAVGAISLGRPQPSPFGGPTVGSEALGAVLRAAGREEHVRAVVVRIDSPGGSYTASDALRREVLMLREKGIPVVASMASVAASGGYFIAMGCDRIVANPSTITGSIGVLAGKAVVRRGLERIGINRETIATAPHAAMFSGNRLFDEGELATLDAWLDAVYADFVGKVAHDRAMTYEQVHDVARGRVWTGSDAAERGLVDTLGGLSEAIDTACRLAGLARREVDVRTLPKANPFEMFMPGENSDAVQVFSGGVSGPLGRAGLPALAANVLGEGPGLWRELASIWSPAPGVLAMPPLRVSGLTAP